MSLLGCVLGFALTYAVIAAVHKLPSGTIPRAEAVHVRWTVVLILAGIATMTTLLSATFPALLVARTDLQPALQVASRGVATRSVSNQDVVRATSQRGTLAGGG